MDLYGWLVVGHVSVVIVALMAHGVSMYAMFQIRTETDRGRLGAILDLSSSSLTVAGIGLLVAVVLGIAAAIVGGAFSHLWPWASIVVLVIVIGSMTPLAAAPMSSVRHALGLAVPGDRIGQTASDPSTDEELTAALAGVRPALPAAIGVVGIVILVWLMRAKPF